MINQYDVPLKLDNENPITAVLSYISSGMDILEMGPASGRLTRYLSEKMSCNVSIVEIDEPSFKKALQYAVDGICANLDEDSWFEYYSGRKFDAIIFTDVIEHLSKPTEVITRARSLLKDGGRLLFSIPNVAHNGVISQLINNQFDYTETGILDATHVKFYTYYSFHKLLESCGMFVFSEKAIHQDINTSDWSDFNSLEAETQKLLLIREFSDVFEYVFATVTNDWYNVHKSELKIERIAAIKGSTAVSTLYFDLGEGFIQQDHLQSNMLIDKDGRFSVTFDLSGIENIKQLRFDPCDYACKIRLLSLNNRVAENISAMGNHVFKSETFYFYTNDPNFLITDTELMSVSQLAIEGEISKLTSNDFIEIIDEKKTELSKKITIEHEEVEKLTLLHKQNNKDLDFLNKSLAQMVTEAASLNDALIAKEAEATSLNEALIAKEAEANSLNEALIAKTAEANSLNEALIAKEAEANSLNDALIAKTAEANSLNEALITKTAEANSLNEALITKTAEANAFDEILCAKTAEAQDTMLQLNSTRKQIEDLSASFDQISAAYNSISNSTFWRLTKPIRVVMDGIKLILRFILDKAGSITVPLAKTVRYLKYMGFRATIKKIESKIFRHKNAKGKVCIPLQYNIMTEYSDIEETGKSVSIIIPAKNGGEEYELLLKNLKNQKGFVDIEIIVVDSGSTDNTVEISKKYGAKVIEIKPEEFSHSYSRNLGVENSTKEYLCVMTQDALPTSEYWLYHLYQVMNNNTDIAAVSCAEYSRSDSDLYHRAFAWNHYKYLGALNADTIMSMPEDNDPYTIRQNGQLSDITCFIRRDTILKYRYRGSFAEDLDLGMRIIADGFKLAFLGNEVAIHSHDRVSYYYLKRRFVELVTLKGIFPDQQIIDYRYDQVLKETIFIYYYISELFKNWCNTDVSYTFLEFRDKFMGQYRRIRKNCFPSVEMLNSLNKYDRIDTMTKKFLDDSIIRYKEASTSFDEHYNGLMIDAMEGYLNVVLDFMAECYEIVENEIVEEYEECVYKIFASVIGTFFAYSYLSNEDDRVKYKDFYNIIGEGV